MIKDESLEEVEVQRVAVLLVARHHALTYSDENIWVISALGIKVCRKLHSEPFSDEVGVEHREFSDVCQCKFNATECSAGRLTHACSTRGTGKALFEKLLSLLLG